MIVLIEEIGDAGLDVARPLEVGWLASVLAEGQSVFKPAGPAQLSARFDRIGDKLLLTGDSAVQLLGECRRCLCPVKVEVPVHFELDLVPRPADQPEEGGSPRKRSADRPASFDLDAADEDFIEGREIDLGRIAREQILLALPMDALCKDECKGLCTVCGQDLNVRECGCQRKATDPRWAALKGLKLG